MNKTPCNPQPIQFINCCQVMDCIDIKSNDNSVTIVKDECGVDLSVTGNNLDKILKINNGQCIDMVKEFIDGVLHYTPVIDWECVAAQVCDICTPAPCPAPLGLQVILT